MYYSEDEKESAKCSGLLRDCGTADKALPTRSEALSAAQLRVGAGHNGIETMVRRNGGIWVRATQLPELFCSWDLAYRCTRSGWLRPIVQGKRRTIYRLADVLACMQRIEAGELPLPRRSKSAH